jgi:hypothetical protein
MIVRPDRPTGHLPSCLPAQTVIDGGYSLF